MNSKEVNLVNIKSEIVHKASINSFGGRIICGITLDNYSLSETYVRTTFKITCKNCLKVKIKYPILK